ncbi:MAG: hypothetical protein JWP91_4438 [Fibrobacteres bacterium]|nr:hypothetical protein [Fibrobacterota bacterium]
MDAAASEGAPGSKSSDGKPLSEDEKSQVVDLEKRDREVKAHEAAHSANAGGFAKGGAGYEYQTGPDGRKYAVGGHVDIDVSPVRGDPQATLQKAQTVQRAALAPADPSGQDRAVAAAAAQMAMQAQKEMNQGGEAGGTGGPVDGNRTSQPDGGRDPRRAYSRVPSRTGSGLSVYA